MSFGFTHDVSRDDDMFRWLLRSGDRWNRRQHGRRLSRISTIAFKGLIAGRLRMAAVSFKKTLCPFTGISTRVTLLYVVAAPYTVICVRRTAPGTMYPMNGSFSIRWPWSRILQPARRPPVQAGRARAHRRIAAGRFGMVTITVLAGATTKTIATDLRTAASSTRSRPSFQAGSSRSRSRLRLVA